MDDFQLGLSIGFVAGTMFGVVMGWIRAAKWLTRKLDEEIRRRDK